MNIRNYWFCFGFCFVVTNAFCQYEISYMKGLERCEQIHLEQKKAYPDFEVGRSCGGLTGYKIPKIEAVSLKGKLISEQYFKDKITVLFFWSLTCPPCLEDIPILDKMVDNYDPRLVNFIAISRESDNDIKQFVEHSSWRFVQFANGDEVLTEQFLYKFGLPVIWIVGRDGIIEYAGLSLEEMEDVLYVLVDQ